MTHETTVEVEETVPRVRITRSFDAPIEHVYRAHLDPALYAQWVGPDELSTKITEWDARTGGAWRFVQTDGSIEHAFRGTFHELRPPGLAIQTFTYEGTPDQVLLNRLILEQIDPERTQLTVLSLFEAFEDRDQMLASGMVRGMRIGYERLDALLSKPSSISSGP